MRNAKIIITAALVNAVLWVAVIYVSIHSNFEFAIKLFSAGFGCCMVAVLVGIVAENLIKKDKLRHATLRG